jgi:hypothetical protein
MMSAATSRRHEQQHQAIPLPVKMVSSSRRDAAHAVDSGDGVRPAQTPQSSGMSGTGIRRSRQQPQMFGEYEATKISQASIHVRPDVSTRHDLQQSLGSGRPMTGH